MTGTTNGVTTPDDDGGIPADLLADGEAPPAEQPSEEQQRALAAEKKAQELHDRVAAQQEMIVELRSELRSSSKVLKEVLERTKAVDQRSVEQTDRVWVAAMEDARNRMRRASTDGDTAAFDAAMRDHDTLLRNAPPEPAVLEWTRDNPWFYSDDELHDYAISRDQRLMAKNPNMPSRERLAKVREEVVKRFPDKFPDAAPKPPPAAAVTRPGPAAAVTRPGPQGAGGKPKPKGKSLADLPDDAKQALARIKRRDPSFTDDDYLKSYKWDN
jgi:hypothetical protein